MGRETVPPWTRLPCDECGVEHQATRDVAKAGPFVCSDCKTRERWHTDGLVSALGVCLSVAAEGGSAAECVQALEALVKEALDG